MGIGTAISSALRQYAVFSGRARRSEFWWFALFQFLVMIAGSAVDAASGSTWFALVLLLALLLPSLAVSARRLHDTGRSGWWNLVSVVPLIGPVTLLIMQTQDSVPIENKWGPSPKYPHGWPALGT